MNTYAVEEKQQSISFSTDMMSTKFVVHPSDGYSDTRAIDIMTQVFDGHDNRWLEPRVTRVFLRPDEIDFLGQWLQQAV